MSFDHIPAPLPDRDRPLQRRIAQHRAGTWRTRTQYSAYDNWNDERSQTHLKDPTGHGYWPWETGFWCDNEHSYLVSVACCVVFALFIWVLRACNVMGS